MASRLKCLRCLGSLLVGASGLVQGQSDASLPDPTRPPMAVSEPVAASPEGGALPPSGLQTIILGKGHQPMAVINGVTIQLGGKVGDATLVRLSESEAVLQGPSGREILYLTPGVEKVDSLGSRQGEKLDQGHGSATGRQRSKSTH